MEIVKKNMLSVICGVVAVVALIALVWPVSGMYADEQAVINKSVKTDADLRSLLSAPRSWPVIPDVQSGEKASLKRFPSEAVIDAGTAIKDEVHKQALAVQTKTVRDNEHALLYPGSLPVPKDLNFRFQGAYLAMVQDKPTAPAGLRAELKGTAPPVDKDVHDAADKLWYADYQPKILTVAGKPVNAQQINQEWQTACESLEGKLQLQRAQAGKVYIDPEWLSIQKAMLDGSTGRGPSETEIWYAQNMFWVQTDLLEAIKKLNQDARDVQSATVKQISRVEVADDSNMYVQAAVASGPQPAAGETPGKAFGISPTGRVCNPLYDVIQFQLVITVAAAKIPIVLTELQRGKLITVQQVDMSAVDGIAAAQAGYIYGDVPVTKLTIRGEELFLRDWTVKYMPEQIKQLLQVPPPANPGK